MDSYLYRDVHVKNLKEYGYSFLQRCEWQKSIIIWIVIPTEMCMTKNYNNMHSDLYKVLHEKTCTNIDIHLYKIVHDKNVLYYGYTTYPGEINS